MCALLNKHAVKIYYTHTHLCYILCVRMLSVCYTAINSLPTYNDFLLHKWSSFQTRRRRRRTTATSCSNSTATFFSTLKWNQLNANIELKSLPKTIDIIRKQHRTIVKCSKIRNGLQLLTAQHLNSMWELAGWLAQSYHTTTLFRLLFQNRKRIWCWAS